MTLIKQDHVIRITPVFTAPNNTEAMNVWHFVHAGANDVNIEDHWSSIVSYFNALYGQIDDHLSTGLEGQRMEAYDETDGFTLGEVAWPSFNGANVNDPLPSAVSLQVDFGTTDPAVRGRKYIPGLTEQASDGDIWYGDLLTDVASFISYLLTNDILSGDLWLIPAVWSRKLADYKPIMSGIIQAVAAYQRRRKPGIGS